MIGRDDEEDGFREVNEVVSRDTHNDDLLRVYLRGFLKTAEGRKVFHWIIHEVGRLNATTFSGELPLTNAFNEGKRKVALDIYRKLYAIDSKLVHVMEDEAKEFQRIKEG